MKLVTRSFMLFTVSARPRMSAAVRQSASCVRAGTFAGALALAVACGGDPQVPSAFKAAGSIATTATVASTVGAAPEVRITDAKGRGIRNLLVRWRVTAGGGKVVNDSVRTGASGEASSGGWTLGTTSGAQTLQATADGLPPVTFTADALPGPAARLLIVSGGAQRAVVNTVLPAALSVRALDFFGNPVPGVPVGFSVLTGDGAIAGGSQVTNAEGVATLGAWRLGSKSGDQIVRVTSGTLQEVSFSATADAGPVTRLTVLSSTTQEGASRAPAPSFPSVRASDDFGNPVGNVLVAFTPGAGAGTVSSDVVSTDPATGVAAVTWTLGTAPQQTLIVSSPALPGASTTFSASKFDSEYDIDVRFVGTGGTVRQREAFAKAVVRWRRILGADLHTTRLVAPAGDCQSWVPALDETANDLVIYARLAPIDGPGRILGQAGPCYINGTTNLTALGIMEFDLDDLPGLVANETLDAVVLHEVGHVLGIGTLWSFRRALLVGRGSADPYYVGDGARNNFVVNGGVYPQAGVPVENIGGAGTRDAHWRQSVFGRELMQGFSSRGLSPLSATTSASLADLG
ncbi:MAG: leishmanolysin-related zinc metalloendopeptidase, partial [Gemmatimonas sp.]